MLKSKCQKALDILKVISSTDWGTEKDVLLNLYRAIVRSKLDYGSLVYGSARKSYLQTLDAVHHQGLRLCLGASEPLPWRVFMPRQTNHHFLIEESSWDYCILLSLRP